MSSVPSHIFSKVEGLNLQNLITWFGDSFGNIIIVIEFIDGKIFNQLLVASP
jgi:hypothetical protein